MIALIIPIDYSIEINNLPDNINELEIINLYTNHNEFIDDKRIKNIDVSLCSILGGFREGCRVAESKFAMIYTGQIVDNELINTFKSKYEDYLFDILLCNSAHHKNLSAKNTILSPIYSLLIREGFCKFCYLSNAIFSTEIFEKYVHINDGTYIFQILRHPVKAYVSSDIFIDTQFPVSSAEMDILKTLSEKILKIDEIDGKEYIRKLHNKSKLLSPISVVEKVTKVVKEKEKSIDYTFSHDFYTYNNDINRVKKFMEHCNLDICFVRVYESKEKIILGNFNDISKVDFTTYSEIISYRNASFIYCSRIGKITKEQINSLLQTNSIFIGFSSIIVGEIDITDSDYNLKCLDIKYDRKTNGRKGIFNFLNIAYLNKRYNYRGENFNNNKYIQKIKKK